MKNMNDQKSITNENVHILAPFHFASLVALIYCKLLTHGITCNTFTVQWVHQCCGSVFVDLVGHSYPPVYIDPHKLVNKDVNCYEMFDDPN